MELIKNNLNIDFVGHRRIAMAISGVLIVLSLLLVWARGGLNYGIDFSGGVLVHVRFQQARSVGDIRDALSTIGLGESDIQDFGSGSTEFLVLLPVEKTVEVQDAGSRVSSTLVEKFGAGSFEVLRVELVGPRVGAELRERAILAVLFSTVVMGIYIWLRFEWRFAIGAAVALIHDVLITVGALVLMNYEFDLGIVAALLTIVGFSVNDTVVISDRIRENMRKSRREPLPEIVNRSINETLSRTIITTGTAELVILALFVLGGNVIHGFAFALLVGFIAGVYSTVYIAAPLVIELDALAGKRPAR